MIRKPMLNGYAKQIFELFGDTMAEKCLPSESPLKI